jgi:signal transduction histidine kinase
VLVALLRLGYGLWPGVLVGAFLTHLLGTGHSASVAGAISVGCTAAALLAAFLMRRFSRTPNFLDSARDVLLFVGMVAPLGAGLSALNGASALLLGGIATAADYGATLFTWWLGDMLGVLVWAPFLLAWTATGQTPWPGRRIVEGAALTSLLVLVSGVVFAGWFQLSVIHTQSPLTFLPVPFVLWAAYRFGLRGAGTASAITAAIAVFGTLGGGGPFVRETMQESLFLQLQKAHNELDDRVRERTADLVMANDWLVKAFAERQRSEGKLREVERLASIGTLATGIAHEINNPLGAILVAAESALVARGTADADETVGTCLDEIVQQADQGGQIVRSILEFARREPTERWPNDLNRVIRTAMDMTRSEIIKIGAVARLDLEESLPQVQLNPFEIQQVLVSIIQNCVDVGNAETRITVRSERTRSRARVTVEDNGPGLSEQERRQIFDPFYTTRRREGGTGLGLSIAHAIVTQHGGEISVARPADLIRAWSEP